MASTEPQQNLAWLVTLSSQGLPSGRLFTLGPGDRFVIGSARDQCDVIIEGDGSVRPQHAQIVVNEKNGCHYIAAAGPAVAASDSAASAYEVGVLIGSVPFDVGTTPSKLQDNCLVRIGRTRFLFRSLFPLGT